MLSRRDLNTDPCGVNFDQDLKEESILTMLPIVREVAKDNQERLSKAIFM